MLCLNQLRKKPLEETIAKLWEVFFFFFTFCFLFKSERPFFYGDVLVKGKLHFAFHMMLLQRLRFLLFVCYRNGCRVPTGANVY